MTFPCTSCGVCCKTLPRRVPGWPLRADGACAHLQDDDRCAIYATRPDVCRVGVTPSRVPDEERLAATAAACNALQEAAGTPETYRVRIA
jgi:Fe-S-cluster containining protein